MRQPLDDHALDVLFREARTHNAWQERPVTDETLRQIYEALLANRADVHRFMSLLNARRVLRDVEHEEKRVALSQLICQEAITWHGVKLGEPDWRPFSHSVAFTVRSSLDRTRYHIIANAYWEPLEFELPSIADGGRAPWRRWIDTFLDAPHDIVEWERAPLLSSATYRAEPCSVVVLFAGLEPDPQGP